MDLNRKDKVNEMGFTKVTSEQIQKLTPEMTYKDIILRLGETKDIGSGIYILVYEVDENYLLKISLKGDDAQLGATGKSLLKTIEPK